MAASAPGAAGGGGSGVAIALNGSGTTAVKVAVRIRPLNAKELFTSSSECVRVIPNTAQIIVGADLSSSTAGITTRSFTFDEVYPPSSTQEQVYNTSVAPLVARFVEGYNSTTLAYGQTGSGKTWSMGTVLGNESLPPELQGIVPRAIRDMFQRIDNKKTRNPDGYKCVVSVAFLELYNEDLVDLLNPRPKTAGSSSGGPTIREDAHGNIVWVGVREADVHNPEELMSCLQRGSLCRTTGSTDMNVSSSRSHALFSVILRQQIWTAQTPDRPETQEPNGTAQTVTDINDEDADPQTHSNGYWRHLTSKFHFVDLAGSERLKRTNAEGDRKKEGISINQGLLALGNVISALGDENRKTSHVPYRDSKLTRMLQDSLGGNSQTLMLACISPSDTNYGETVSTLTYANRARNIRNRVVVNQEFFGQGATSASAEKEIRALRTLVSELKDEVASLRAGKRTQPTNETAQEDAFNSASEALLIRERERQLLLQEERDLSAKLEKAQQENRLARFNLDRLTFRCSRLAERVNLLAEELSAVTTERDVAIISLEKWKSGRITRDAEASKVGSHGPDTSLAMIASYNQTISELRFRVAEADDRLAWYNEVVADLEGKKVEKTYQQLSKFDPALDVPTKSQRHQIAELESTNTEASHERRLLRVLQRDSEMGRVLSSNTSLNVSSEEEEQAALKLFGLPPVSTATHRPTHLSNGHFPELDEDHASDGESDYAEDGEGRDAEMSHNTGANSTDQSANMYLLIHRLQADIQGHQALVDRLTRREQENLAMRQAYEGKIAILQAEKAAAAKERDEALKRLSTNPSRGAPERAGTAAIKAQFEAKSRKLEAEIALNRKKLAEAVRSTKKSENENLTKQLNATIESLKMEKANMVKELKKEVERSRTIKSIKEREITKLRRREKAAAEMAKKLERSNQLQRLILKRRSDEVIQSQTKLKSVLSILKRKLPGTASNNVKLTKPMTSGTTSPTKRPRSRGTVRRASTPHQEDALLESLRLGLVEPVDLNESGLRTPPTKVRAKFKKQMIDKELATVVTFKLAESELENMKAKRDRLIGEQKELLNERERCVQLTFEQTGVWEPEQPQYMDERLGVLDLEVAMANSKIRSMEEEIRLGRAAIALSAQASSSSLLSDPSMTPPPFIVSTTDGDLGWENALNLLRSLDGPELEIVSTAFLEDLLAAKVSLKNCETQVQEAEKSVQDLRSALDTMRGAALQTALEYRKEMEFLKEEAAKKLSKALELAAPAATERNEVVRALTENTSPTATPRLQRMFDAAYGRGFVDVPSKNISRLGRNAKLDLSDSTKDSSPRSDLDEGQTPDPASMIDEREEFEIKRRLEIQEHNSRHQRHHRRIVDEVSGDLSDTEHQDEVPGLTRGRSRRGRDGFDPPVLSPGKTKDKRFSRGFQPSEAPTDANKGDDTVSISSESQSEQGGVKEGKIRRPDKSLSPTRIPDPNIKRVVNVRRGVLPISPRFGAGALSLSSEAPYTAPQSPGRSNRLRSPSHPRDSSAPPPSKSISSSSSTSSSSSLSSVSPRRKSSTPALLQSSSVGLPGSVVGSRPSGMVAASPSPSPTFGMSGESISGSSNGNHQHHHHRPHSSLHEDGISRWQTLGAAEPPDGFSSWGDIAGARTAVGSEHSHYRSATKRSSKASLTDGSDHSDVFARLATSHTLASQAKVIHRDKDPPPVD